MLLRLRRQRRGDGRVGKRCIAARGRLVAARLIRRLHRVDSEEVRREVARIHELRRTAERRSRRIRRERQRDAIRVHCGDRAGRDARVRVRIGRRARAGKPLVIQERTAERAHEEVVGERVLLRDLPQRQLVGVQRVVAHHQTAGIGDSGEPVVLAAVDLHLVLVEAVVQVARRHADRRVEAVRIVDREGGVRQVRRHRLRHRRRHAGLRETVPDLRQRRQHGAVAVELLGARGGHVLQAVGARELAIEVIEAAVFRVNHHDVLDRADVRLRDVVAAAGVQADRCCDRDGRRADQFLVH